MSGRFLRGCWSGLVMALLVAGMLTSHAAGVFAACGTVPTVNFEVDALYARAGGAADFVVAITNNAAGSCDFDLATSGDSAGFTSSLPDGTPFAVAGGATATTTLRVNADAAQADWTVNTTTLSVDAVNLVATTTVFDNNPLLHNSINLESTKHGGNWGVDKPGNTYGKITCGTCHVAGSSNIKRVRTSITTPDNANGSFPGDGQPVSFLDPRDGSSDFGNDTGGHAISDRICETCHSATKFHNYDTANNTDGLTHFNQKDCTSCHAHSEGFKAGACSGCHGGGTSGAKEKNYWPDASNANLENDTPGRHLEHMNALASLVYGLADAAALLDDPASSSKQVDLCGFCHSTPGGDGDHGAAANLPAETAFHPVWDKGASAAGSYAAGSCSNIACHNGRATGTGTYGWLDSGASACIMCHSDVTSDANTTGETHNDHINAGSRFGRGIVCADCHDSAVAWGVTPPANNHLNGVLNVSGTVTLSYAGAVPTAITFAGCGTNTCHNSGTDAPNAPLNSAYTWASDGLSDCGICHAGAPTTGSHAAHTSTGDDSYGSATNPSWIAYDTDAADTTGYDFGCGQCHGDVATNHLNGTRNNSGTGWNGTTCSTAYCHSHKGLDGVTTAFVVTPAWGGSFPAGDRCAQCHENSPISSGHEEHQVGFHYNAVYSGKKDFMPVLNSDPLPIGLVAGPADNGDADVMDDSYDPLRGHGGKLAGVATSTTMTCYVCHNGTVTAKGNDLNPLCATCHDDVKAPLMGTLTVASTNLHVNGVPDVVFMAEKVRSKAQVRDDLFDVLELSNNWTRTNSYKQADGSSFDESPDTLANLAASYGGWTTTDVVRYAGLPEEMTQPARTCLVSCHLWEKGRVDKYPVHWDDNSIHGPQPIMCIDCHTRLPK